MEINLAEEGHGKWHEEHHEMAPEMHKALKKRIRNGMNNTECLKNVEIKL